ncbi:MAG: C4-type zinc ribbon domain-containing protein [Actinomycetota bacterium]|nr:C4-type zinc ribbon domain-containing protein [Actinomycetota bacterium]MEC8119648.1 C4-type zinc ribbon domain-containing protein [Actinomycetota bacterium]
MTIATSENLHVLLEVQEKDSQILAANHEIKELPERKEIEATQRKMLELDQALKAKESEVHENNRIQKRLEDEVATVEERIENQKRKLYGGEVIAVKELQALEMDIDSLKERQIAIEDQIIEVMELNEPIQNEIQNLSTQQEENKENEANLFKVLQEAIKKIELRINQIKVEIVHLTNDLPNELISEYESLRSRPGHVGIARLVNRTCHGCNLELPAVEVDRIKKLSEDSIINCEECGCILVR